MWSRYLSSSGDQEKACWLWVFWCLESPGAFSSSARNAFFANKGQLVGVEYSCFLYQCCSLESLAVVCCELWSICMGDLFYRCFSTLAKMWCSMPSPLTGEDGGLMRKCGAADRCLFCVSVLSFCFITWICACVSVIHHCHDILFVAHHQSSLPLAWFSMQSWKSFLLLPPFPSSLPCPSRVDRLTEHSTWPHYLLTHPCIPTYVNSYTILNPQPMEVYVDDETKLTLHGLQQHYVKLQDREKNRKLFDLLDVLEFNQVCWSPSPFFVWLLIVNLYFFL